MAKSLPSLYDVCMCNHESMLHVKRTGRCFFNVPVGQKFFRGGMKFGTKIEPCGCKKFKFSSRNTADPKPTMQGESDE